MMRSRFRRASALRGFSGAGVTGREIVDTTVRIAPLTSGTQVPYRFEAKPELRFHFSLSAPRPRSLLHVSPVLATGQEMDRAGAARTGPVRGRARRVDRQRRAPV